MFLYEYAFRIQCTKSFSTEILKHKSPQVVNSAIKNPNFKYFESFVVTSNFRISYFHLLSKNNVLFQTVTESQRENSFFTFNRGVIPKTRRNFEQKFCLVTFVFTSIHREQKKIKFLYYETSQFSFYWALIIISCSQ